VARMLIRLKKPKVVADGRVYSAYCEEFDIGSCGITEKEALDNLDNALTALFRSLDKSGLLEIRLKEKGIQFSSVGKEQSGKPDRKLVLV
jgi:predicted RNase H-like HicB family nuclease